MPPATVGPAWKPCSRSRGGARLAHQLHRDRSEENGLEGYGAEDDTAQRAQSARAHHDEVAMFVGSEPGHGSGDVSHAHPRMALEPGRLHQIARRLQGCLAFLLVVL